MNAGDYDAAAVNRILAWLTTGNTSANHDLSEACTGVGGSCWDVSLRSYLEQEGVKRVALLLSFRSGDMHTDQQSLLAWLQHQPDPHQAPVRNIITCIYLPLLLSGLEQGCRLDPWTGQTCAVHSFLWCSRRGK